ncbi:MAG: ABC transporter permease [Gemmatimonadales bacterium]
MSWIDGLAARLRMLFRRAKVEAELDEELEFHLEQETAKQRERGLAPDAARRAARLELSAHARLREEVRDEWSPRLLAGLRADLRDAIRQLRRRPGFSLLAAFTLALGIGANTAIFSLVRGILIEPLPYRDPAQLALIWTSTDPEGETWLSDREFLEYRRALQSFSSLGAVVDGEVNLNEDGEPERVRAAAVTASVFETLGVAPIAGRVFQADEDVPGADLVVVLGERLWDRRFGRSAEVIGRTIRVNGRPRTVIGVMPASFRMPLDYRQDRSSELWVPLAIDETATLPWGSRSDNVVGRLAEGVSLEQASDEIGRVTREWAAAGHLGSRPERTLRGALPLDRLVLGAVRPALQLLFAAVGVVLLVACANVAHLLLARSDVRRREIATRAALGAGRARLARQLLVESGLLGALGGALGIAIAAIGLDLAIRVAPTQALHARDVSLSLSVLGYTAGLAVLATVLSGLAPILELTRVDLGIAMGGVRGESAPSQRRLRRVLVSLETALALVLVIGAVLLARSFSALKAIDIGFHPTRVLTARVEVSGDGYAEPGRVEGFYREVLDRLREVPGVVAAGATRLLPLSGQIGSWTITTDRAEDAGRDDVGADWQIVTPGYVEAAGLDVVAGRAFAASDDIDAPLVALVSETMAERIWSGDALGRRFHLGTENQPWIEVVGVLRDVRHNAVVEDGRTEMYLLHSQWSRARNGGGPRAGMTLLVRTAGDPNGLLGALRRVVRALDPTLPVSEVKTLEEVADAALAGPRFTTTLLGVFAGLAMLLATIGLYAVMSYTAARRTREIGVRIALGAGRRAMVGMVVGEGLRMTAVGVAGGLAAAAWATRFLRSELYHVEALDPATFVGVPALLLLVAGVAAYLPARRAARVSPLLALRDG